MSNNILANVSPFDFPSIFGNFSENWYYYLALLLVIVFVVLSVFIKKNVRNNLSKTQKIVYVSMLTAISALFNFLTFYPASYIAISFTTTVCFIAGFLLGSKAGFAVGFIGDLIGAIIFPAGAYNPLIGIASGLAGFIPGFLFEKFKLNFYVLTAISFITTLLLCTSGINTLALWLMYGMGKKTFFAYLIVRLPWQLLIAVGNFLLSTAICVALKKFLPKEKFNLNGNS